MAHGPTYNFVAALIAEELNTGGIDPAGSVYYINDPVSFTNAANIEAGEEIVMKNGDGGVCCAPTGCDTVKGASGDFTVCSWDPLLKSWLADMTPITNGSGEVTGSKMPFGTQTCQRKFSIELWERVCFDGVEAPGYVHTLLSGVTFTPNDGDIAFGQRTRSWTWKTAGGSMLDIPGILGDWDGGASQLGGEWYSESDLPSLTPFELIPVASLP